MTHLKINGPFWPQWRVLEWALQLQLLIVYYMPLEDLMVDRDYPVLSVTILNETNGFKYLPVADEKVAQVMFAQKG